MHLSRYLKIFPCQDKPDHFLLYSTLRSSIVQISGKLLQAVRENRLDQHNEATLARLGFLVSDLEEERDYLYNFFVRTNKKISLFSATVVLNLDCNLSCSYCYEGHFSGNKYMSRDTADTLIYNLSKHINSERSLNVTFYGGEPLLSLDMIYYISKPLRELAQKGEVKFSFSLVTNGTLLTEDVAKKLIPLGLTSAKVTLDGPRKIHDNSRPYISGLGTFDAIIKNMKEVNNLIQLSLGGNYTSDNYRCFPNLLDYLIEQGLTPDKIASVQFAPVVPKAGERVVNDFISGCTCNYEPWLMEASLYLREEILKRGYVAPKLQCAGCVVELDNNLIIGHDGSLFKCPAFMAYDFLRIGHLTSGIEPYVKTHNLEIWKSKECLDCAYLPLCFGGCRFLTLLRNGTIDQVDCRKTHYDATLEKTILQDLQYQSPSKKIT